MLRFNLNIAGKAAETTSLRYQPNVKWSLRNVGCKIIDVNGETTGDWKVYLGAGAAEMVTR